MVEPGKITVLSWNIDGLEEKELCARTEGVIKLILKIKPEIVFLQEIVPMTQMLLLDKLVEIYEILSHDGGYFNGILLKKDCNIKLNGELKIVKFPGTCMERHYIMCKIDYFEHPFVIITTHLESLKDYAIERQNQLKKCFDLMQHQDNDSNVIFAGDLNLRELELKEIGGIPNTISDAWEVAGKTVDAKFTWDLKLNDNKQFEWGKPRARYDRMYYKPAREKNPIHCVDFKLVGDKRLPCKMFPSDHFGIMATFIVT